MNFPKYSKHNPSGLADSVLQEDSVIRNFRITAAAGKTYVSAQIMKLLQEVHS